MLHSHLLTLIVFWWFIHQHHSYSIMVFFFSAECNFDGGSLCLWSNSNEQGYPHPQVKTDWTVQAGGTDGLTNDHTSGSGQSSRLLGIGNQGLSKVWILFRSKMDI